MIPLAADFSAWWIVGWALGFGGAVAAALLLVRIILLGRRIVAQAEDVRDAIDGARDNTSSMFAVARTNLALDRIVRALHAIRRGEA